MEVLIFLEKMQKIRYNDNDDITFANAFMIKKPIFRYLKAQKYSVSFESLQNNSKVFVWGIFGFLSNLFRSIKTLKDAATSQIGSRMLGI